MAVGQHGNATSRVLLLEKLDLRDCRLGIIAAIDDQQEGLLLRQWARDEIVKMEYGINDAKSGGTKNSGETFSEQGARPYKDGRKRSLHCG